MLLGSAWLSPDKNEVVAVLVNLSTGSRNVDLSMVSGEAEEVRTYVTDRSRNLRIDTSLQDLHNMIIPARSVVTVVIGLEDATGPNEVNGQWQMAKGQYIFNLAGQRLNKMQRGINIVKQGSAKTDGRQVIIK